MDTATEDVIYTRELAEKIKAANQAHDDAAPHQKPGFVNYNDHGTDPLESLEPFLKHRIAIGGEKAVDSYIREVVEQLENIKGTSAEGQIVFVPDAPEEAMEFAHRYLQ